MKKSYETPTVDISLFAVEDVISASSGYSQGEFEGWAPDSDDSEFG